MKPVTEAIRRATALTLKDFCEQYLGTKLHPFLARLSGKAKLYPNEVLFICLITGENPQTLFGKDAVEMFLLRGKESVNENIRTLLERPDGMAKLNLVLGNLSGLKIDHGIKKKERSPEKREVKTIVKLKPVEKEKKSSAFDFVDRKLFSDTN